MILIKIILILIYFNSLFSQQESGDIYRRYGIHNGNLVKTVFSNWGVVGQPGDKGPQGAWINDNNGYIGDVSLLVGVELESSNNNNENITFHSVVTCPVDRPSQSGPDQSNSGLRWGFEPVAGYLNSSQEYVAMSTNPDTWPNTWPDNDCNWGGAWCGYFGKDTQYIQQESFYVMNDNNDQEFNYSNNNEWGVAFKPDSTNNLMNGLGLEVKVRGMQWQQILAQDCIFFLYEITNNSTTDYKKVVLGELVGTYIGNVESEADDDWSFFDVNSDLTYTGDFDNTITNNPNWQGDVGMVGYAFLESPGNPYDGIDNDGDFVGNSAVFDESSFIGRTIDFEDYVILIDDSYNRKKIQILNDTTVVSLGLEYDIILGETVLIEGSEIDVNEIDENAFNGYDDDLDGLIDENYYLHYRQKRIFYNDLTGTNDILFDVINPRAYIDYLNLDNNENGFIENDLSDLIDESRSDGIDNDNDWIVGIHDVGSDGVADTYDSDGTEGNGYPDSGEPNFDRTDPDESDQIGLTSFDYFVPSGAYPMSDDEALWEKLSPGFFDVPQSIQNGNPISGEDGDFIFGSGYFPLRPGQTERFSIALIYGENKDDLDRNKEVVQEIYDNDYQFPPPPAKPTLNALVGDSKVTLYWDRIAETTIDPVLMQYDFQGYKLYKSTDPNFNDIRNITNAYGIVEDYIPIAQFDLADNIDSLFYPSYELFQQSSGLSFNLGDSTGLVHTYVDSNLINGQTYYYALSAYDSGDPSSYYPAENTKYITLLSSGEIITDKNTLVATPTVYTQGVNSSELELLSTGENFGTGEINYIVVDESKISGNSYLIEFYDTSNDSLDNDYDNELDANDLDEIIPQTTFYNVINLDEVNIEFEMASYDTLPYSFIQSNIIPESFQLYDYNNSIIDNQFYNINFLKGEINISKDILPGSFKASFNYYPIFKNPYIQGAHWNNSWMNIEQEIDYNGNSLVIEEVQDADVFDGIMLDFKNDWNIEFANSKWILDGFEIEENNISSKFELSMDTLSQGQFRSFASPNDYMIVFNDNLEFSEDLYGSKSNFKLYDITNDIEIEYIFNDNNNDHQISHLDRIYFFEDYQNNSNLYTWNVGFNYFPSQIENQPSINFGNQDTLYLYTKKPFRFGDEYTLNTSLPSISEASIVNFADIRVVPNPYYAASAIESSLPPGISSGRGERKVEFQNLPLNSKVRIYNSRGQHIITLDHDGNYYDGSISWNLRTKENADIAYGVYLYIVESDFGIKKGKLAIIK